MTTKANDHLQKELKPAPENGANVERDSKASVSFMGGTSVALQHCLFLFLIICNANTSLYNDSKASVSLMRGTSVALQHCLFLFLIICHANTSLYNVGRILSCAVSSW